jgi:hypothetical protein
VVRLPRGGSERAMRAAGEQRGGGGGEGHGEATSSRRDGARRIAGMPRGLALAGGQILSTGRRGSRGAKQEVATAALRITRNAQLSPSSR